MSIPADLKYTATHEWVRSESDGTLSVGITHHAQDLLGDLVFVERPAVGKQLKPRDRNAAWSSRSKPPPTSMLPFPDK
jgi:glycine cleavage system H protein